MRPDPALTIVHVVFSSRLAGGERHCVDLAQAQAAMGHRVHVVGPSGSAIERALGPTVRYHPISIPIARGVQVRRIAGRVGADVCHGHLGPACKAVATVRSASRIATLHVGFKAHHHARMDGLVCVNTAQRGLLGAYDGFARVVHNWPPRRDVRDVGDLRAELGLLPGQLLVGSLGRLNRAKGMDLLVTAFRASAPADAVLAILGDGEEMPALRRLAGDDSRIHLLGYRAEVNAALDGMDLFVSPSREEAFPLAILEAMRAGLPIIATATQGPREMLARQPAQLVPLGDVPALGAAIAATLARLRPLPRSLRQPVNYDLSAYDRDAAVAEVDAFYRHVIGWRRGRSGLEAAHPASRDRHA